MFSDSFHLFLLPYFFFAFISSVPLCVRVGANYPVCDRPFRRKQIPERADDHYGQRWSNRIMLGKIVNDGTSAQFLFPLPPSRFLPSSASAGQ